MNPSEISTTIPRPAINKSSAPTINQESKSKSYPNPESAPIKKTATTTDWKLDLKLSIKQSIFMKDGIDIPELCNLIHCSETDLTQIVQDLNTSGKLDGDFESSIFKTQEDPDILSNMLMERLKLHNLLTQSK